METPTTKSIHTLKEEISTLSPETTEDQLTQADLYYELGLAHLVEEEAEEGLTALEKALEIRTPLEETPSEKIAQYQIAIGEGQAQQTALPEAIAAYEKAQHIYEQLDDKAAQAKMWLQIGTHQAQAGQWDDFPASLEKAEALGTESENWSVVGLVHSLQGEVFSIQQKPQEALNAQKTSIRFYEKANDFEKKGNAFLVIADILIKHNKDPEALESYENAVEAFTKGGEPTLRKLGDTHSLIAKYMERKSKYEGTITAYTNAISPFKQIENWPSVADAYYQMGYVSEQNNDVDQAKSYYQQAQTFAEKAEDEFLLDTITDSLESLSPKKETTSDSNKSGGGLFSKIKNIFGGKG